MKKNNIFWGVVCILAAVFLVISKLGYFGDLSIWTLLFTVFFGITLCKGVFKGNVWEILFSVAFLLIIYDKPLGIEELTPWTVLGAALLGSIGLSFIFPSKSRKNHFHNEEWKTHANHFHESSFTEDVIDVSDESYIKQVTRFGATTKYVNSDNFKRAELECSFGAMAVYFDKAQVKDGTAYLDVQVHFAGMELYVPKEWTVCNNADCTLGGIEEKNRNCPDGTVTLVLTGSVSFAGIDIIYV